MLFQQKTHQNIHYFTMAMVAITMLPLPRLASLSIIFALLNWGLSGSWSKKIKAFQHPLPILFSSLFFIYLIGMSYSSNVEVGWRNVETKLSLLLFPLLFFTGFIFDKKEKRNILDYFVGSTFLVTLFSFFAAVVSFFKTGIAQFSYRELASHIHAHPSYFGLYVSFSFFISIYFLEKEWNILKKNKKHFRVFLSFWLLFFVFLLSARMVLISTLLLLGFSVLLFSYKKKILLKGIVRLLIGLVLCSGIIWTLPTTKHRIKNLFSATKKEKESQNIRIQLWNSALDVYKIDFIRGQGTGDVQEQLDKIYKEKEYSDPLEDHLNLHNQYLQTLAALGVIGLLILLSNLLIPFILSIRQQYYLHFVFLSLFMFSVLTESMLEREHGVFFYCFFNCLLSLDYFRMPKEKED